MGNVARDAHCDITTGDATRDIHCDVTMINDFVMCTYHGMTMHNAVAMKLLFITTPSYVILIWVVWNENKNKFVFDQTRLENVSVVMYRVYLFHLSFELIKYPYTKTMFVFPPD